MTKSKRKISSSQRDKLAIETAKILKKKGVLSKQTKLHGGKYISRAVLKKVQEFQHVAKPTYTALKVSKAVAQRAKIEGYQVVGGNRIIVPKEHDFVKRVRQGMISGIKPVKGGFMSEVTIPFRADNVQQLLDKLERGTMDDLKLSGEQFAFSFHGHMSYRAFLNTETMREYLRHYKQDEEITALKIYRLRPEDVHHFIKGIEWRRREKRKNRTTQDRRLSGIQRRPLSERLERMHPNRANIIRNKMAKKQQERRDEIAKDPAKLEAYREAARARAKASRERKKQSKK